MLGVQNRFAALKIDGDSPDSGDESKGTPMDQNQSNAAAKKKNKKKKKETDELRNMAFGATRPATGKQQKGPASQSQKQKQKQSGQQAKGGAVDKIYEEWAKKDQQFTDEQYQHDLQEAIMISKIEAEQQKQARKQMETEMKAAGIQPPKSGKEGRKKKKKDKPQAMSLDQFQQLPPKRVPGSDDEDETENVPPQPHVLNRIPPGKQETHFFDETEKEALKYAERERTKQQYQEAYAQQHVMQSKHMDILKAKDREIVELRQTIADQEGKIKEVKLRCEKLCRLLGQGEMKDKKELLDQVYDLTKIKDELTDQVQSLTAELEKEKSKVHTLKLENERLKGKHGK